MTVFFVGDDAHIGPCTIGCFVGRCGHRPLQGVGGHRLLQVGLSFSAKVHFTASQTGKLMLYCKITNYVLSKEVQNG